MRPSVKAWLRKRGRVIGRSFLSGIPGLLTFIVAYVAIRLMRFPDDFAGIIAGFMAGGTITRASILLEAEDAQIEQAD